jgi:hypothetical protein
MIPLKSLNAVLFTFLVLMIRENHGQAFGGGIEMIPNMAEHVIEAGSELKLTCKASLSGDENKISWQLPDNIVKYPEVSLS